MFSVSFVLKTSFKIHIGAKCYKYVALQYSDQKTKRLFLDASCFCLKDYVCVVFLKLKQKRLQNCDFQPDIILLETLEYLRTATVTLKVTVRLMF